MDIIVTIFEKSRYSLCCYNCVKKAHIVVFQCHIKVSLCEAWCRINTYDCRNTQWNACPKPPDPRTQIIKYLKSEAPVWNFSPFRTKFQNPCDITILRIDHQTSMITLRSANSTRLIWSWPRTFWIIKQNVLTDCSVPNQRCSFQWWIYISCCLVSFWVEIPDVFISHRFVYS